MAQRRLNINLQEEGFPVLSSMKGEGTIIPDMDQSLEKPELLWADNVVPVARGLASVSYVNTISPGVFPSGVIDLAKLERTNVYVVQTSERSTTYLLIYGPYHYVFDILTSTWNLIATVSDAEIRASVFFFRGQTYVYHPSIGLNNILDNFSGYDSLVIQGLNLLNIRTFAPAGNYLVCADSDTIYWSSPLNPLYFIPDGEGNNYGAGSTKISAARGSVNLLVSSTKGAIIYTTANAIEMSYTGNAQNPWRFIEVLNSSGVYWSEHVTGQNNIGMHFLWSDTGLCRVAEGRSTLMFPEVSDFLAGHIIEYYNEVSGEVRQDEVTALEVKMALVTNRYLVVSYGKLNAVKDYVLVYDIILQRWGRLTIQHLDVFDLDLPSRPAAPDADAYDSNTDDEAQDYPDTYAYQLLPGNPDENFRAAKFGVITPDGAIKEVNLSDTLLNSSGRLIFSGIAMTRNRWTEIFDVAAGGKNEELTVAVRSKLTDGEYTNWVEFPYFSQVKKYLGDVVGSRHEVKVEGKLHISSLVINLARLGTE